MTDKPTLEQMIDAVGRVITGALNGTGVRSADVGTLDRVKTILRRLDTEKPENVERVVVAAGYRLVTDNHGRDLYPRIGDAEARAILRAIIGSET